MFQPALVVEDAREAFGLTPEQCEVLRGILLMRGVNKALYQRRLFIHFKHALKDRLKSERHPLVYRVLNRLNAEAQAIAKVGRWVEWPARVHGKMARAEAEIQVREKPWTS